MEMIVVRLTNREGTEYADVSGSASAVEKLIRPYLVGSGFTVEGLASVIQSDTPALVKNASAPKPTSEPVQDQTDLLTFYRKLAPKSQSEQLLAITYHGQVIRGQETMTQADYEAAYRELRRIPVEPPKKMNSAVQNAVNRHEWIRPLDNGCYILTDAGREQVESILRK